MSYYDLSSSDKSDEDAESCSEDDHDDDNDEVNDEQDHNQYRHTVVVTRIPSDKQHLWTRSIVHVDVDSFYCQCEQVDGPPDFRERPVAIGQKHIIVTCNYLARDLGVKKLQSKQDALRACPSLLILEGSDLERYRRHSRHIYLAFREELQLMGRDHGVSVPVRKGGMDEAFGDMTNLVTATLERNQRTLPPVSTCAAHVYGNDSNETSVLTEDQTGAQTIVHGQQHASALDNAHVQYGSDRERRECQQRLECAAAIAERVRRLIYNKVGFVTTMGISVSPMLAKLASDLKKPNSLNILYPWRSGSLIPPMPLRKIPELGYGTLKALRMCLEHAHSGRSPDFWTCRDLVHVPRHAILAALERVKSFEKSSDAQCTMLLEKCRGVDHGEIYDDYGGLTKTVSVENSMKRGTVTSKDLVWKEVHELFRRLPRLLDERQSTSSDPASAFPTTLRLTARIVDKALQASKRRPFTTRSKQVPFDGKTYMADKEQGRRHVMLQKMVYPMLRGLVFDQGAINVTRINLAVTNFQDLRSEVQSPSDGLFVSRSTPVSQNDSEKPTPLLGVKQSSDRRVSTCTIIRKRPKLTGSSSSFMLSDGIDPSVLAELPEAIAEEVRQMYKTPSRSIKASPKGTIDCFFARKASGD